MKKQKEGIDVFQRKEFERVTPESVGIASREIEWLLDQLESGFTEPHGLMIMRHGKICAEGWWSPYAPGIRHGEQSHSKTYAATAVGIAYTEGLLRLDERIVDIFPEDAPEQISDNLAKLTVHHVLCMGCGMDEMPMPSKEWIRDFLAEPVVHEPGTTYMYNSVGSSILGAIVRKKSGLGLHEYLKPRLYDKIGIFADNHRWMSMPDGMEIGGGGLFATTEDNLRLMKLYADGGVWEGERILAKDYVRLATTLQNESATEERKNPPAKDNFVGYGYQIWMCRPEGVYRADGAMGQFTIVVPDKDMIIAITENAAGAHWAQTTLDVMWKFLERMEKHPASEENLEESGRLAGRMSRLALPHPAFCPYSPIQNEIQGKNYQITEGEFYLTESVGLRAMSGAPMPERIQGFSFDFHEDSCILHYRTAEKTGKITIALDGFRRWNRVDGEAVTQALLSGAWIGSNQFEITIRWIETCNEQKWIFQFDGENVRMKTTQTVMFGGQLNKEVLASIRSVEG